MLSVPGEPALLPLYSSRHRALPWGSSRDGKSSEHYADVPRFLPYTEGPLPPETVVSRHFDSELISCTLILNYGRQSIPTYTPGHRLNSGPFGTMGVGVPFGVGAKAAKPDKPVLVLHGDGSFGMNAMEMDTAVRHNLPVVTVISLNGGWTADPDGGKIGRQLGYQRYEKLMDAFGGHGEYVEQPADIRPALERAFASGKAAIVNVKTDFRARATTMRFTDYTT